MLKNPVITIDGPAGAGKSTVGRVLAKRFSFIYLDTGALYRAYAYKVKKAGISSDDEKGLTTIGQTADIRLQYRHDGHVLLLDGKNITDEIRTEEISILASTISARPCVRQALLAMQREIAVLGGVVADGRDMGTVVFPDADYKFFIDASVAERARRRFLELSSRQGYCDYEQLEKDMIIRDKQDRERKIAPLKPAQDAVFIDSTGMTVAEVVDKIAGFIHIPIPE
jgi:CMP/dCMP kinase